MHISKWLFCIIHYLLYCISIHLSCWLSIFFQFLHKINILFSLSALFLSGSNILNTNFVLRTCYTECIYYSILLVEVENAKLVLLFVSLRWDGVVGTLQLWLLLTVLLSGGHCIQQETVHGHIWSIVPHSLCCMQYKRVYHYHIMTTRSEQC